MTPSVEMLLKDKVVVISGGAGLLGKTLAQAVAEAGGEAVIADINAKAAEEAASKINSELKGSASGAAMDITSVISIENLIAETVKRFGKIDALVNNAYPRNKNYGRKFEDVEYSDFCENVNLHLGGYFLTSQKFAEYFKKQGSGNIINISSVYGVIAPRFEIYEGTKMTMPVEYAVIKSAVIHLTKYLAKYLKGSKIRVNSISPGGIFDSQPESFVHKYRELCLSKGLLDGTDVKGTLQYLLSDGAKYVNGQNIVVDDGFSI